MGIPVEIVDRIKEDLEANLVDILGTLLRQIAASNVNLAGNDISEIVRDIDSRSEEAHNVIKEFVSSVSIPLNSSGSTMPWLPSIQLLALILTDLSGPLPGWLGQLPAVKAIVLSGNAFSGPVTPMGNATDITHFAAGNNKLVDGLDAFEYATRLEQLDVGFNRIGGSIPEWLANRSASIRQIQLRNNLLSCGVSEQLTINHTDDDSLLSILVNKRFWVPATGIGGRA